MAPTASKFNSASPVRQAQGVPRAEIPRVRAQAIFEPAFDGADAAVRVMVGEGQCVDIVFGTVLWGGVLEKAAKAGNVCSDARRHLKSREPRAESPGTRRAPANKIELDPRVALDAAVAAALGVKFSTGRRGSQELHRFAAARGISEAQFSEFHRALIKARMRSYMRKKQSPGAGAPRNGVSHVGPAGAGKCISWPAGSCDGNGAGILNAEHAENAEHRKRAKISSAPSAPSALKL